MEQILQIGIVKFAEADYRSLLSNFILIATLATIFYIALFVNEEKVEQQTEEKDNMSTRAVKGDESDNGSSNEEIELESPKKTPRKYTPSKKVEMGHITSPEGRRTSVRLRNKTPAK